jgi:hypothetical protein
MCGMMLPVVLFTYAALGLPDSYGAAVQQDVAKSCALLYAATAPLAGLRVALRLSAWSVHGRSRRQQPKTGVTLSGCSSCVGRASAR